MLDLEVLEDVGLVAVDHRRIEEIGSSDPPIQGLEIAPFGDEHDLLAAVGQRLPSDLGVEETVVLPRIVKRLTGLFSKAGHMPGKDTAPEDANDQVPYPFGTELG